MGGWASVLFFARAGRVGVEILSSKTGWAWVGARTRPALSEVLTVAEAQGELRTLHAESFGRIRTKS